MQEDVVSPPHKNETDVVQSPPRDVVNPPPVHLRDTPEDSRFSGEDLSGYASPCVHAREAGATG